MKTNSNKSGLKKSYKDLISQIAKELTGNTYEIQFELKSNTTSNNEKSTIEDITSELGEQFKVSNNSLKYNDVDESNKRIRALEEKNNELGKDHWYISRKIGCSRIKKHSWKNNQLCFFT